jgi:hypothetical protein
MPITRFTAREGKVVLTTDSKGRDVARELDDYRVNDKRGLVEGLFEDDDEELDDEDELSREFGSSAAAAIRSHLYNQRKRLQGNKAVRGADGSVTMVHSPLKEIESQFRTLDRMTAAQGSTEDLAFQRRSRSESRDFYRLGSIPPLMTSGSEDDDDEAEGTGGGNIEQEVGKGRRHDAQGVFGKNATVMFPYGKPRPSPTYHPDYPTGSGVGDNPNDEEEERWMHELNKMIYEEEYTEMALGELDENYNPIQVQGEEIEAYMREKDRVKKYNLLDREDRSKMDREEKEDEILEMIKRGDDPNQEAFGPW